MKDLTFRVRSFAVVALLLAVGLGLGLFVTGCGDDDDGNKIDNKTKYAELVINHNLTYSRGVDTGIVKFVLNGYNDEGLAQFPTTTYNRTTSIRKSVPVTTKSIRISYLDKDDNLVGLYVTKVALRGGAEYEIDDPAWQDIESQTYVQSISLSPDSIILDKGNYAQFTVMAKLSVDGEDCLQDVTDETTWILPNGRVILIDEGFGNLLAYNPGVVMLTADYLGATAEAKVTVLGEGDYSVKAIARNVKIDEAEPERNTYWLPLKTDIDFPGAVFNIIEPDVSNADIEGYYVKVEDTDIVTYEDRKDENKTRYALFKPKAVGTTTAFIYYKMIDRETGEETTVGVNLAFTVYNGSSEHLLTKRLEFETNLGNGIDMELWQVYSDDDTGELVSTYVDYRPFAVVEQSPLELLATAPICDLEDENLIIGFDNRSIAEGTTMVTLSDLDDQVVMLGEDVVGNGSVEFNVTVGPHIVRGMQIEQYVKDPNDPGRFIQCDISHDDEYGYDYYGIAVPETYYYCIRLIYTDGDDEDVTANAELDLRNFYDFMGTIGKDEATGWVTITPLEAGKGYEFVMQASLGTTAAPVSEVIRIEG